METNKSNNRQPLSKCEPPAGNIAEVEAAWLAALANTYFDEFINMVYLLPTWKIKQYLIPKRDNK